MFPPTAQGGLLQEVQEEVVLRLSPDFYQSSAVEFFSAQACQLVDRLVVRLVGQVILVAVELSGEILCGKVRIESEMRQGCVIKW